MYRPDKPTLAVVGDGVSIGPSKTGHGNGLFATRNFASGEAITAYYGKILLWREARALAQSSNNAASHLRNHVAMTYSIDGKRMANGDSITDPATQLIGLGGGAFANDSHGTSFLLNAVYDFWDEPVNRTQMGRDINPAKRITFLRAITPITEGDEIFISYGEDYWSRC